MRPKRGDLIVDCDKSKPKSGKSVNIGIVDYGTDRKIKRKKGFKTDRRAEKDEFIIEL